VSTLTPKSLLLGMERALTYQALEDLRAMCFLVQAKIASGAPTDSEHLNALTTSSKTGRANPGAVHIGFAFTYDANMIVQGLSLSVWRGYISKAT